VCYKNNTGKIDGSNNSFTGTIPTSFGYLPTCSEFRIDEIIKDGT
jgi:putative component of membrane protein insertase Oxa1/YidC/SpoIIIJ protein YidD